MGTNLIYGEKSLEIIIKSYAVGRSIVSGIGLKLLLMLLSSLDH